jgi:hypothetical protein
MLFSNGRTEPHPLLLKRRTLMQLELFPTGRQTDKRPTVLIRLNPEERAALIKSLARLLVKTIRPPKKGLNHER